MRILNVIQCTNLGGMEQASLGLMKALSKRGHTFEVLSLNPLGALKPLLDREGIPSIGLQYRGVGGWRSWRSMHDALAVSDAESVIMTGHNLMFMLAMGDFCAPRRILAMHYHHAGVKPAWQWRLIYRIGCHRFRLITFPSDFVRREAECILPAVKGRSATIRNPLLLPPRITFVERSLARTALELPADARIVGGAGWLIPRKRWDVFVQVAEAIAARDSNVFFVIAGDGPEHTDVVNRIADAGLNSRFRLLGWRNDLSDFYRALDLLLFHSDFDAYPTVPQEAMSHGIPVVASLRYGGLGEVMCSPEVGILLGEHVVADLAAHALRILSDPEYAARLADNGRRRIAETADPDTIARQYEEALMS